MSKLPPTSNWYVIARSDQCLNGKILSRTILNKNVVLYRGSDGRARAFEDKCPHKMLPLSLGKLKENHLVCRYHGWEFNSEGELHNIPCHGENEKLIKCRLVSYSIVEQDEWIWIWPDTQSSPQMGPPHYEKQKDYYWFECHNVMEAPIDLILENGLDCSHTGFVHTGLFRSNPTQFVEAHIEKTKTGVRVETFGEKNSDGKDIRSLLSGGNDVKHIDEYIVPHTVKVDYEVGKSHIVTILICTPETEKRTRVYTRMAVRYPYFTSFIGLVVEKITNKVIAQDKIVLEAQAQNVPLGMRKGFVFSTADAPTRAFFKAFDQYCNGEELWEGNLDTKKVTYKL